MSDFVLPFSGTTEQKVSRRSRSKPLVRTFLTSNDSMHFNFVEKEKNDKK